MLVIRDKNGQLCNRLWGITPFINDAIDKKYKLIIVYFEYQEYFENLKKYNNIIFIRNKYFQLFYYIVINFLLVKISNRYLKFLNIISLDFNIRPDEIDFSKKIYLIDAWNQKKPGKLSNIPLIQKKFKLKNQHTLKVDQIFADYKKEVDLIIGFHLRRGDYKYWCNGKYYYSDSIYNDYLKQIIELFENKKITFLLCSNEKFELNNFNEFNVFTIPDSNSVEDLYGLSSCDYILGPTSSYSKWASFYGQKPLCILNKPDLKIKLSDFSIIESLYKFKNGKIISRHF